MGTHVIRHKDATYTVTVKKTGDWYEIHVGDTHFCTSVTNRSTVLAVGGERYAVETAVDGDRVFVELNGRLLECDRVSDEGASGSDHGHSGEKDKVYAPMPGKFVKALVNVGDTVTEKQALAVVESMKMENQALALAAGVVTKINYKPGEQVDTDNPLVELEISE